MAVDFKTLTLQDALDLAILVEEEAQERYGEFAQQMETHHTPEAARFFRDMVGYEAKHGAELASRRERLFPGEPRRVGRNDLWDVEAPEYDEARAFMSIRAAMEVALHAERKAYAYFDEALAGVSDPEVRTLFEELRQDERHHEALVLRELAKYPPDAGDAFDAEDEPVAQ